MRLVELGMRKNGNTNAVIPLQAIEGTIVILGFIVAILLNAAFVFIVLFRKSIKRPIPVSKFILWFNVLMLPVEIWYSFFVRH
ncbi:MAG: hypothetical protein LH615_15955 [Ferruginibacter sp.]|nr:hypothetical protein [Ferruginibacter sp.]